MSNSDRELTLYAYTDLLSKLRAFAELWRGFQSEEHEEPLVKRLRDPHWIDLVQEWNALDFDVYHSFPVVLKGTSVEKELRDMRNSHQSICDGVGIVSRFPEGLVFLLR